MLSANRQKRRRSDRSETKIARMRLSVIIFIYCCLSSITGKATETSAFLDTVQLRRYEEPMRAITHIKVNPSDSIYVAKYKETRYFNTDTIFHYLATRGYRAVEDELYYYYYDIVACMTEAQAAEEIKKMQRIARRYKNPEVSFEAEFLPLFAKLISDDEILFEQTMDELHLLALKQAELGNTQAEIYILRFIFNVSYINGFYAKGFRFARLTADRLDEVTDEEYPDRKATYFMIGNAYHAFRDYPRSVPYLKASLREDGPRHKADRANLRALSLLGKYYADTGDLEQSDTYYLSMWNSPDQVKTRPLYDISALTGLAVNEMKRGDYDTPLRVFKLCLPYLQQEKSASQEANILVNMAECYLAKDDLPSARRTLDSCSTLIRDAENAEDKRRYYTVENQYYTRIEDSRRAQCYLDSTLAAHRQYEDKYNALVILRAEQELFESEKTLNKQKMLYQQTIIRISLVGLILLGLTLLLILFLYRKKHAAYHQLVLRTQEWATEMEIVHPKPNEAEADDLALMDAIARLIEEEKVYREPDLNISSLADRLGVSRNAISKAVNTTQQKKFTTFINDYRIRESIRLLSDPANDRMTTDAIATDAGFNSRETFYRAFKARTGITPTLFRKNRS